MATAPGFKPPSLNELYSKPYDDRMNEWRRIGALDKADNLQALLKRQAIDGIENVLEVGCGGGQVLSALSESGMAREYVGLEIGDERQKEAKDLTAGAPITIRSYDGKTIPYSDSSFDLVYSTHVLEHVSDERGFLHELRRVARQYIYIEVPLELHLRTSISQLKATLAIGHINSYTMESFALTLETSGLEVIDMELFDFSPAQQSFHSGRLRSLPKIALRKMALKLGRHIGSRIFTYHCGALCRRAPLLDIS